MLKALAAAEWAGDWACSEGDAMAAQLDYVPMTVAWAADVEPGGEAVYAAK